MIVSKQKDQLVLVRQDEHGPHASEICTHWGNNTFSKLSHHDSLSFAVKHHDMGWKKSDDEIMYDTQEKGPLHFANIDLLYHLDFYEQSYQFLLEKDAYAGLLMSMHWMGLYTRRYGYQQDFVFKRYSEVEKAVIEHEKMWVDLKHKLWNPDIPRNVFEDDLWMHYELFQFIDRISLFISWTDPEQQVEADLGPVRPTRTSDPVNITVSMLGDGRLQVTPFPFENEFEVKLPVRKIPNKEYSSHLELVDVVQATEREFVQTIICS